MAWSRQDINEWFDAVDDFVRVSGTEYIKNAITMQKELLTNAENLVDRLRNIGDGEDR